MFKFTWDSNLGNRVFQSLIELKVSEDYSESEMAVILSEEYELDITRNMVHGILYRRKITSNLENYPEVIPQPYFNKYQDQITGNGKHKAYFDFEGKNLKILVLNDLHVPFQNEEVLEHALIRNMAADVVVLSEMADMYSQSTWMKESNVPLEQEIEEILRLFQYFSENFPHTIVLTANHERRISRKVASKLTADLLFLVDLHIMEALARPFPNIHIIDNWYYQINDAMFAHEDRASIVPMKVSTEMVDKLRRWAHILGIEPFRLLVQGHSHKAGAVQYGDVKVIETGMLCNVMTWAKLKLTKIPWTSGWATVIQENGITNFNKSREFVWEDIK